MPVRPAQQLLVRVGLWSLVGLGGVGGLVGLLAGSPPSQPAPAAPAIEPGVPVDVAGFAVLAVDAWLGAGPDHEDALAELYAVEPELPDEARHRASSVSVVGGQARGSGYWAVTVAAWEVEELTPNGEWRPVGTWFLEVGVVADDSGGLRAVSEPAMVPGPSGPEPRLEDDVVSAPRGDEALLVSTVEGFLAAAFAGDGDLARYVAPGVDYRPVVPPPFIQVRVSEIGVNEPEEGDGVRVRAIVAATTTGGAERSLSYELVLAERAGRWEVTSVTGAPTLRPDRERDGSRSPGVTPPAVTSTSVATAPGA